MYGVYVIASGKGGTGKTSFTSGVGCALASLGITTLCIDADIGVRGLDTSLHVYERAVYDFSDVANGIINLKDAYVTHEQFRNLHILTAPHLESRVTPYSVAAAVNAAKSQRCADIILIDAPAGFGEGLRRAAVGATGAILVSHADPVSLRSADSAASRLEDCGITNMFLVVNRVVPRLTGKGPIPNLDDAIDMARLPLLGYVPDDIEVLIASADGHPVISDRSSPAGRAYINIAKRLLGEYVPIS